MRGLESTWGIFSVEVVNSDGEGDQVDEQSSISQMSYTIADPNKREKEEYI